MNIETGILTPERRRPPPIRADDAPKWQPRTNSLRLRILTCLVGIDLLCLGTGFSLAILLRDALFGGTNWLFLLLTMLPVYLVAAIYGHAYTAENLDDPFRAARRGIQALAFAIIATVFIGFSLGTSGSFPRLVTAIGFVLSSGLMLVGRYYFVDHFEAIVGGNPFNVVLIRDGNQPIPSGSFSAIIPAETNFDPEARDPLMYHRLAKALQGADRVVVACPPDRRETWAHALKGASVQGEIVLPELASLAPLGFGRHGNTPTMVVATGPLKTLDRAMKRSFDLVLAGGLMLLIWPLLVLVAIAVKCESRGPALFRQTRIGRGNEMFQVLKFRSMRDDLTDGAGHRSASRDDERITRVGRLIRSTSIDELPQLFNVLKGDMSIVGPRPHALGSRAADKLFWEVDERYWHRHAAKPGLTGLAQVRGFRGATPMEADLANRLQADLEYLENWSLWRDVKIILLTFRVILHRNAF